MEEKELKTLFEILAKENGTAIREAVKAEFEAAKAGILTPSEFTSKCEALDLKPGAIKAIGEQLKAVLEIQQAQGEAMRKFQGETATIGKTIKDMVHEKADAIRGISKGGPNVKLEVNKTLVTRSLLSGSTMGMRLTDVSPLAYPNTIMSTLFRHAQVSPNSGGVIRYMDQAAVTRNAAWVAEGAQKPESAISWIERLLPIEKVADSIPVTKEAWNDIAFIESEIRRLLEVNLALKIDDALYDGTGVTPIIKGVYTSAPAFVTTPYADTVEGANLFDLIMVVAADIASNAASKYNADTVLLNPINMLGLSIAKDSGGRYLLPPFANIQGNAQSIGGLKIVGSAQVTPNTMVVGDFRFGTIYDLEDFTIEMGWINDQFIKNCFTILAEQRLALLIRTGDEPAFRKVTNITTALGDLETPAA